MNVHIKDKYNIFSGISSDFNVHVNLEMITYDGAAEFAEQNTG